MPFNGGWRSFKIVAPLTPNREQELIGGLKNALDRGESLAKAKQSFLNAGYKPEEINSAVQKMPSTTSQVSNPVSDSRASKNIAKVSQPQVSKFQPTKTAQPLPKTTTTIPGQKKQISKKFIIILISSGALVLVGAALLGIFWSTITGWFS